MSLSIPIFPVDRYPYLGTLYYLTSVYLRGIGTLFIFFCIILYTHSLNAYQGPPGGKFIICRGIVVARNNGLFSFIASNCMFSMITISYIPSKFTAFLYLDPQLVLLALQAFNVSLQLLHLSYLLLLLPLHLLTPMEELILIQVFDSSGCSTLRLLRVDRM